jgi:hypothetical protein
MPVGSVLTIQPAEVYLHLFCRFFGALALVLQLCILSGVKNHHVLTAALCGMPVGSAPTKRPAEVCFALEQLFTALFGIYSLCAPEVHFERRKKTLDAGCRTP